MCCCTSRISRPRDGLPEEGGIAERAPRGDLLRPAGPYRPRRAFKTVIDGLWRALKDAEREFGMTTALILCFLRHLDEAERRAHARRGAAVARPLHRRRAQFLGEGPAAVQVRARLRAGTRPRAEGRRSCRRGGAARVCLAGTRSPEGRAYRPRQSRAGGCGADRRLVREQMPLTVCPLSNFRLCVVPDLEAHPLRRMLQRRPDGDDQFRRSRLFRRLHEREPRGAVAFCRDEIVTLARNGFRAAFCDEATRQRYLSVTR